MSGCGGSCGCGGTCGGGGSGGLAIVQPPKCRCVCWCEDVREETVTPLQPPDSRASRAVLAGGAVPPASNLLSTLAAPKPEEPTYRDRSLPPAKTRPVATPLYVPTGFEEVLQWGGMEEESPGESLPGAGIHPPILPSATPHPGGPGERHPPGSPRSGYGTSGAGSARGLPVILPGSPPPDAYPVLSAADPALRIRPLRTMFPGAPAAPVPPMPAPGAAGLLQAMSGAARTSPWEGERLHAGMQAGALAPPDAVYHSMIRPPAPPPLAPPHSGAFLLGGPDMGPGAGVGASRAPVAGTDGTPRWRPELDRAKRSEDSDLDAFRPPLPRRVPFASREGDGVAGAARARRATRYPGRSQGEMLVPQHLPDGREREPLPGAPAAPAAPAAVGPRTFARSTTTPAAAAMAPPQVSNRWKRGLGELSAVRPPAGPWAATDGHAAPPPFEGAPEGVAPEQPAGMGPAGPVDPAGRPIQAELEAMKAAMRGGVPVDAWRPPKPNMPTGPHGSKGGRGLNITALVGEMFDANPSILIISKSEAEKRLIQEEIARQRAQNLAAAERELKKSETVPNYATWKAGDQAMEHAMAVRDEATSILNGTAYRGDEVPPEPDAIAKAKVLGKEAQKLAKEAKKAGKAAKNAAKYGTKAEAEAAAAKAAEAEARAAEALESAKEALRPGSGAPPGGTLLPDGAPAGIFDALGLKPDGYRSCGDPVAKCGHVTLPCRAGQKVVCAFGIEEEGDGGGAGGKGKGYPAVPGDSAGTTGDSVATTLPSRAASAGEGGLQAADSAAAEAAGKPGPGKAALSPGDANPEVPAGDREALRRVLMAQKRLSRQARRLLKKLDKLQGRALPLLEKLSLGEDLSPGEEDRLARLVEETAKVELSLAFVGKLSEVAAVASVAVLATEGEDRERILRGVEEMVEAGRRAEDLVGEALRQEKRAAEEARRDAGRSYTDGDLAAAQRLVDAAFTRAPGEGNLLGSAMVSLGGLVGTDASYRAAGIRSARAAIEALGLDPTNTSREEVARAIFRERRDGEMEEADERASLLRIAGDPLLGAFAEGLDGIGRGFQAVEKLVEAGVTTVQTVATMEVARLAGLVQALGGGLSPEAFEATAAAQGREAGESLKDIWRLLSKQGLEEVSNRITRGTLGTASLAATADEHQAGVDPLLAWSRTLSHFTAAAAQVGVGGVTGVGAGADKLAGLAARGAMGVLRSLGGGLAAGVKAAARQVAGKSSEVVRRLRGMMAQGAYPSRLGVLAEGEEAAVAAARARGAGKVPEWVSDWLTASRDLGGSTAPISKGARYDLEILNRLGLRRGYATEITNLDEAGSWFARTDTAAHESFHAWTFENLPAYRRAMGWKIGETPIGALVRYGDETVAYSVGHLRALRPHLIPLAPYEAQFSLLNAAEQRVVDTAFRGFRASLLGGLGGYGVVKGYEYVQDHSQGKPVMSPTDGR